jgi:hypothetical protein
MDRNTAIARIKTALKTRTGRTWSVTGGRGTAWGWITITAPPARRVCWEDCSLETCMHERFGERHCLSKDDRAVLSQALGKPVRSQGESIPASSDYRQEYVDRAEGRTPTVTGTQYWD